MIAIRIIRAAIVGLLFGFIGTCAGAVLWKLTVLFQHSVGVATDSLPLAGYIWIIGALGLAGGAWSGWTGECFSQRKMTVSADISNDSQTAPWELRTFQILLQSIIAALLVGLAGRYTWQWVGLDRELASWVGLLAGALAGPVILPDESQKLVDEASTVMKKPGDYLVLAEFVQFGVYVIAAIGLLLGWQLARLLDWAPIPTSYFLAAASVVLALPYFPICVSRGRLTFRQFIPTLLLLLGPSICFANAIYCAFQFAVPHSLSPTLSLALSSVVGFAIALPIACQPTRMGSLCRSAEDDLWSTIGWILLSCSVYAPIAFIVCDLYWEFFGQDRSVGRCLGVWCAISFGIATGIYESTRNGPTDSDADIPKLEGIFLAFPLSVLSTFIGSFFGYVVAILFHYPQSWTIVGFVGAFNLCAVGYLMNQTDVSFRRWPPLRTLGQRFGAVLIAATVVLIFGVWASYLGYGVWCTFCYASAFWCLVKSRSALGSSGTIRCLLMATLCWSATFWTDGPLWLGAFFLAGILIGAFKGEIATDVFSRHGIAVALSNGLIMTLVLILPCVLGAFFYRTILDTELDWPASSAWIWGASLAPIVGFGGSLLYAENLGHPWPKWMRASVILARVLTAFLVGTVFAFLGWLIALSWDWQPSVFAGATGFVGFTSVLLLNLAGSDSTPHSEANPLHIP